MKISFIKSPNSAIGSPSLPVSVPITSALLVNDSAFECPVSQHAASTKGRRGYAPAQLLRSGILVEYWFQSVDLRLLLDVGDETLETL